MVFCMITPNIHCNDNIVKHPAMSVVIASPDYSCMYYNEFTICKKKSYSHVKAGIFLCVNSKHNDNTVKPLAMPDVITSPEYAGVY